MSTFNSLQSDTMPFLWPNLPAEAAENFNKHTSVLQSKSARQFLAHSNVCSTNAWRQFEITIENWGGILKMYAN